MDDFDFIVVGGGTAGCTLAGRLAESPEARILIIEAGVSNTGEHETINTPGRAFELRKSEFDWQYKTTFVDLPDYTRVDQPNTRGKVLGGSSCTHYHTWIPGSAATYDDWAAFGGDEWNWKECRDYLYKSATYHDDDDKERFERLKYIGKDGPIPISHAELVPELEVFRETLKTAWKSKGGHETEDVYNGEMSGLWKSVNSIYNGMRSSSWMALQGKPNITVLSQTHSKRLLMEREHQNGSLRCVGVEVILPSGEFKSIRAKRETIVSSGVFESPKLLMLSGIGPKVSLKKFDIPVVVDSPNVGQNLLDHPIMPHVFKIKDGTGMDGHLLRPGLEKAAAMETYAKTKRGPLGSPLLEMVGLPRIDELLEKHPEYRAAKAANGGKDPFGPDGQPHFEMDFVPMFADAFQWHFPTPPSGDYFTVIVDLLRPQSKNGSVELTSANALDKPKINLNYFSDGLDLIAMREGVRWIDDVIMNGEGMKDLIEGEYPWPLPRSSDRAMDNQILDRSQTGFHPCGSLRMGRDIDQGVVDSKLRVFGVEGLRVVDASVIPVIPDGRIQMAVYMIGEKSADMIKRDHADLYKSSQHVEPNKKTLLNSLPLVGAQTN
ncbi:hypothetical protein BJ170DRAFT_333642 [Xylariales sp. AK1849]|nr:hypothetical protein BJ170DRAFT_333642 [Xylariales sp. AK1849]